jgi:uridine phosphorylase
MANLSASELIINTDGSIYHLNLKSEDIADTIITVGDPSRVHKVSQYFDKIDFEMNKREFITHTGTYKGKRITVISSGMGTDNVEILLTELDAAVNIDLKKRVPKKNRRNLKIIRVGTSGALQPSIAVDSFLVSVNAIGLDTLMYFYDLPQNNFELEVVHSFQKEMNLPFTPYCVPGSEMLRKQIAFDMLEGNTVTCPGFYAPQGRDLGLGIKYPDWVKKLEYFHLQDFWLTNFEMETAGYYAMARLLGHEMISLNAIVANRITNEFSKNADKAVDNLIKIVLERI